MTTRNLFQFVQSTALLLALATPAAARTYLVGLGGSGNGCTHSSIGAAITAAANNPGPDEIRLIQGMTDSEQAIVISHQDLTITGGYENCGDPDVGLERTVVSGLGGTTDAVFRITGPGVVRLENLHIASGDSTYSGGGIRYESSFNSNSVNALILTRTVVESNSTTNNGGGLFFSGNSDRTAELILEQDTGFFRNSAAGDGGAIYIRGNALLSAEAQRLFFWNNSAQTGSGGALHVYAPANAVIGSATWLGDATFKNNIAGADGGAIHVDASNTDQVALVRLYSFLPNQPLNLEGNIAGANGGAISVLGNLANNVISAGVCVRNINLLGNVAGDGSALRATKGLYGYCPGIPFPASANIECAPRALCGRISGNLVSGAQQRSSVVRLFGALADLRDTQVRESVVSNDVVLLGAYVAPGVRLGSTLSMTNGLVSNNLLTDTARALFTLQPGGNLHLSHATIADNTFGVTIASASPESGSRTLTVRESILYQPGGDAVNLLPGATLEHVLFHAIPSEHSGNPTLRAGDPQFVPNTYRPAQSSIAVDFAPDQGDAPFDLNGNARPIDLGSRANVFGSVDLGAFEVQFAEAGELFANGYED